MRHTRLAAFLGVLLALPAVVFARDPDPEASALGRTHDPALDVVTDGVTRTRLGALYKDDLVVTDVDIQKVTGMTNLVAGSGIVIEDIPGGRRISATGVATGSVERIVAVYDATNITPRLSVKADRSDTLAGYGITNAYTVDEVDSALSVTNEFTRRDELPRCVSDLTNDLGFVDKTVTNALWAVVTNINDNVEGYWYTTKSYIHYLENLATNNYYAALIANRRATSLEEWRNTVILSLRDYYFTPSNTALVSTVDSRLSPSNSTFVSAVYGVLPPVPTKVSDLPNDAGYVTAAVTNGIPESVAAATNGLPELIAGSTNGLVSASNPVFADAVLAVGLNVSTNDVEAIHRILDEGGDVDWSEYGTVGGALAALIAGFAWLRRKAYASVTAAEVADGVWNLSDGPVTDGNKTSY